MKIIGLQNLSLVDYPGVLAAVVFVEGCNFKCGYCQNPDLVESSERKGMPSEETVEDITRRKKILEGVVITGGEPCIAEGLELFLEAIKKTGLKIKLDTNGSNPDLVKRILQKNLIDYIALDIKTSLSRYFLVTPQKKIEHAVSESIEIIMASDTAYEFRTTCVPGIVSEEDFYNIGKKVKGSKKYCLQQFRSFTTYDKKFQRITPYNKENFSRFCDILKKFVETVEIRGI